MKWNSVVKSIKSEVGVKILEKFYLIGLETEFLSLLGLSFFVSKPW